MILNHVQANDAVRLLHDITLGNLTPDHIYCKIEGVEPYHRAHSLRRRISRSAALEWRAPSLRAQKKIVLRNCGLINPDDIEEYIGVGRIPGALQSFDRGTSRRPSSSRSRPRSFAGAAAPDILTGNKWEFMAKAKSDHQYIICNADEGDPGAYMNRNEIESDPHSLLEGMIIGGYVMGATEGIVYVRAEYPLAVHRLNRAIEQAREYGVLGENILGRGFKFDIEVVEGAGAFVCGEETALIASLEGEAGRPRPRPPFPAQKGLWGHPTNINNVETWYNVTPIITPRASMVQRSGQSQELRQQGVFHRRQS